MGSKNKVWMRQLDNIADELERLTAVCDVNLRKPQVVDRILQNDETVCGKRNPEAFLALRHLLAASFETLNKAIDRLGADEVRGITHEIMDRIDRHRAAGGQSTPGGAIPWPDEN
jgi:hypothetical protein